MNMLKLTLLVGLVFVIGLVQAYGGQCRDASVKPPPPVSHVVPLHLHNMIDNLQNNEYMLVDFYSPTCSHCQKLAPEFEKAALKLKAEGSPVVLGKVDCHDQGDLGRLYNVTTYPTLVWFHNRKTSPYTGSKDTTGIVGWVHKRMSAVTLTPTTLDEFKSYTAKGAMVGFFENKDSELHKLFTTTSLDTPAVVLPFVTVFSPELIEELGGKVETLKVYRPFDEPITFEGPTPYTKEDLSSFALAHSFPYFEPASKAWDRIVLHREMPLVVLVVADTTDESTWKPFYTYASNLARDYVDLAAFLYIEPNETTIAFKFGLMNVPTPYAVVLAPKLSNSYYPPEEEPLSNEGLKALVDGVLDGSIIHEFKSEPVPQYNDDLVKVVVGDNFDEMVINTDMDVLLAFYAPWCEHSKNLMPIYERLGRAWAGHEHVMIAKMDASANDNYHFTVRAYPEIVLFPAGSKNNPIVFKGDSIGVDAFSTFLQTHATNLQEGAPVNNRDEL